MKIDFSDAVETPKKEYKAGVYTVQVVKAEEGTSKSGTPSLMVEFETKGEEVFNVKHWFYITPKAKTILKNFLSAVGVCAEDEKGGIDVNADDLLGARLQVELVKGDKGYLELKPWSCKKIEGGNVAVAKDTEEVPF